MTESDFQDCVEDAGAEYMPDYSGRCMYGKECPAITVDDDATLYQSFVALGQTLEFRDAKKLARTAKTDSMGRGTVVYWPNLVFDEEVEG